MKLWTKLSFAVAGVTVAGCGLALAGGATKWQTDTARKVENLKRAASAQKMSRLSPQDLEDLPAPVVRYFRFALGDNQSLIETAQIRHEGEFKLKDKWIEFVSTQNFAARPPGFVWDAKMRINALAHVRVRDAYLAGHGSMTAKILSLFPVMDARDNDKLDAGALQRYLAEAVWLPTALLPDENLRWTAIDDNRASATLSDSGVTVSLEFEFDESGEIIGVFAPARFRETGGVNQAFPWRGRFWNYQERNGMMIPLAAEVEWEMPDGHESYWKARIIETKYDFVPVAS